MTQKEIDLPTLLRKCPKELLQKKAECDTSEMGGAKDPMDGIPIPGLRHKGGHLNAAAN